MAVVKAEILKETEVLRFSRRAERAWLNSNRWAEKREILRENAPLIDLSFGALGKEVVSLLGRNIVSPEKIVFPNGEFKLRFPGEIEFPSSVYIIGSFPLLKDIGGLQFTGDYLKEKGVEEVTTVCSFLGFTRQDRKFIASNGRVVEEIISLKSIMRSLAGSVDRLIVVDPHSGKTVEYGLEFGLPVLAISAWRYLADKVKPLLADEEVIVAGPDFGRESIARKLADYWGYGGIVFRKERDPISGKVSFPPLTPEEIEIVAGKTVASFDDVITKGETVDGMADLLKDLAKQMIIMATHGEFAEEAFENLNNSIIKKILVTDSRSPIQELDLPSIEVVSIAPFLADIIREDSGDVNFWKEPKFKGIMIE